MKKISFHEDKLELLVKICIFEVILFDSDKVQSGNQNVDELFCSSIFLVVRNHLFEHFNMRNEIILFFAKKIQDQIFSRSVLK